MTAKNIKKPLRTDWERLRAMKDREIDYSDIPALDHRFFENATLRLPKPKSIVTMRLDPEILKWFKKQGKGYQTRINAVLRMYVEAHRHT